MSVWKSARRRGWCKGFSTSDPASPWLWPCYHVVLRRNRQINILSEMVSPHVMSVWKSARRRGWCKDLSTSDPASPWLWPCYRVVLQRNRQINILSEMVSPHVSALQEPGWMVARLRANCCRQWWLPIRSVRGTADGQANKIVIRQGFSCLNVWPGETSKSKHIHFRKISLNPLCAILATVWCQKLKCCRSFHPSDSAMKCQM